MAAKAREADSTSAGEAGSYSFGPANTSLADLVDPDPAVTSSPHVDYPRGASQASTADDGNSVQADPVRLTSTRGSDGFDLDRLIDRLLTYQPDAPVEAVRAAFQFASEAHEGALRESGEPYIEHPLEVAGILVRLEMDAVTIQAALLHDVAEDTPITLEEIRRKFGPDVAMLVDGVTKLSRTEFESLREDREPSEQRVARRKQSESQDARRKENEARRQAENLRKIFLAMARDVRVMIIKLADRLHNMRTLAARAPDKRQKVARETLDIFAPLAHRLGIWEIKWELEDLAFKYLWPEEFALVRDHVAKTRARREGEVQETIRTLETRLKEAGIVATIQGRPKHLWSTFNKMRHQEIDFEAIYDLIAVRVIVDNITDCYQALGVVHDLWKPIAGLFDDYIAKPKSNLYRSLHTKVLGPTDEPVEIQIRTWDMHRTAEYGVAAHWQYKEGGRPDQDFERRLARLREQLFDWQRDSPDASQFLQEVSRDLFTHQVFVFTPRGDVVDLPVGSTPVDFAFRIHSDVGLHCVGARVNGRIVQLSHQLQNGDIVSVRTRASAAPSFDWLSFVKTSHARNKVKGYFRKLQYDENVVRGREALRTELHRQGMDTTLVHSAELVRVAEKLSFNSVDPLLADIGYGRISAESVTNRLREHLPPPETLQISRPLQAPPKLDLSVDGTSGILIRRSTCCLPLPGDDVVGYVTRGRGLAIHRRVCPNAITYAQLESDRLTEVDWPVRTDQLFDAPITLVALSRVGILNEVTTIFSQTKTNIRQARATERVDKLGVIEITAEVTGREHLEALMDRLHDLPDLLSINRGPIQSRPAASQRVAPRLSGRARR